jgi:SAM-dependent methyltransferase
MFSGWRLEADGGIFSAPPLAYNYGRRPQTQSTRSDRVTFHERSGGTYPPYTGFATVYDQIMGRSWFSTIQRSFDWVVKEYDIRFRSAADIGCGTGAFLEHLTRRATPTYGVDCSPAMLAVAAGKELGPTTRLIHQDIRALRLPERVDLITCNFDTLNYILSIRDLFRVLRRCHANLRENGHMVFDMITPLPSTQRGRTVIQRFMLPDVASTWVMSWSPKKRSSVVRMRYIFRGRLNGLLPISEVHIQRWYPFPAIRRLLRIAGFRLRGAHDMETLHAVTSQTFWAKFVAVRR